MTFRLKAVRNLDLLSAAPAQTMAESYLKRLNVIARMARLKLVARMDATSRSSLISVMQSRKIPLSECIGHSSTCLENARNERLFRDSSQWQAAAATP